MKGPALAAIDLSSLAAGAQATDSLLKKAPVSWYRAGTVTAGRWLTLFGGTPAAVEEALAEGLSRGGGSVLDHVYLADVHPRILEALRGVRSPAPHEPLAFVETGTASAAILAAERALKGTAVALVELRLAEQGLAGKGLCVLRGDLHELEAAVDIARRALGASQGISVEVLARPHEAFAREASRATAFDASSVVSLDGEVV